MVWPIVTYGSEAWTLNKELCENIEAFEMQCYGRAMRISYVEHVTNEEVFAKGRPRQGPVGASEITQSEILRSHNETRKFREKHHAGHHAWKTSARWSEETADQSYRSMGRKKPGRNGQTGGEQERLSVLSS